ncbi:23S rRNA (pseudouridine(1915)-N(3))-methyltransferase RlmH [Geobacter sp.]|uniref:23S rRNA (pseudouridine(1915)-N(3))-methyltransferase RlmH n=1 Tax=Geobacter sp. TaxID=46610 RepID=UPI00260D56E2|nr:23S rRNA (pseudouridine(1915)-N(3))-methyltransferase RlmH [Geobacter sp.]
MKLRVLWVGKTQEEWVRRGIDEYAGRIRRYAPLELAEARDEKGAAAEAMRARECDRLEKLLPRNTRLVLLDERGEEMTSPQFAAFIARQRDSAVPELAFAIGGAYGFADSFRARADRTIALSRMTLTHQMVRVVLLEQLYRAHTIINGEPYHH